MKDNYDIDDMIRNMERIRNEKRPSMEHVVAVFDRVFARFSDEADFRTGLRGPLTWSWVDAAGIRYGFEKWFVLSHSAMPGAEGYPLLTIRQATAPRLDAWLSYSQLIVGPSDQEIEQSLATVIANHLGGFYGVRNCVAEMLDAIGGEEAMEKIIDPIINDNGGGDKMN